MLPMSWYEFTILIEFHYLSSQMLVIWCDNMSSISIDSNPLQYECTKHIKFDLHFIWKKMIAKKLCVQHILGYEH